MYRVRDLEKDCWVKDNIYLSPNPFSELYTFKGVLKNKFTLLPNDKYVIHKEIGLYDKNEILIYEGDVIRAQVADDKDIIGLVTYANDLAAYIILCYQTDEYYVLGTDVCQCVEIIGNVFDNKYLLENN